MVKVLAVALGAAILLLTGCSTKGMNDPDSFGVFFNNDLGQPVVLALCHSDHSAKCEHPYYRHAVPRHTSGGENISPDVRTEWAIETPDGRLLKCIVLYWRYWPGHDENVSLSAAPQWAFPCPRATPATPH